MRAFTGCQVVQSGSERGQPLGSLLANAKKRKEKKRGKPRWGFKENSPTCKSLILLYTFSLQQTLTLQFRSSAVLSSNSSPSLKEISVFLKVLWVRMTTLSPSWLMMTVGLVTLPTCRVAKPTPGQGGDGAKDGSTHTQEHQCTTESFNVSSSLPFLHHKQSLQARGGRADTHPGLSCTHRSSHCRPVSRWHRRRRP